MNDSDHVVAMETVSDERLEGIARGIRTRLSAGASGAPDMDRDLVSALSELLASRLAKQGAETEGVTIRPWETRPTGEDAMEPSDIDVHEGAWAVIIGTNAKPAGWIDTHELFAHQLYRDQIPAKDAVCAWPNCTCAPLAKCPSATPSPVGGSVS